MLLSPCGPPELPRLTPDTTGWVQLRASGLQDSALTATIGTLQMFTRCMAFRMEQTERRDVTSADTGGWGL